MPHCAEQVLNTQNCHCLLSLPAPNISSWWLTSIQLHKYKTHPKKQQPSFFILVFLLLRPNHLPELSARGMVSQEQWAVSEQDCPAACLGQPPFHCPALLSGQLSSHDLRLCDNLPAQPQYTRGQVCRRPHLPPDAGSPDRRCHELFVPLWPAVSSGLHPQAASFHLQLHCVPGLHHCALPPGRLHF